MSTMRKDDSSQSPDERPNVWSVFWSQLRYGSVDTDEDAEAHPRLLQKAYFPSGPWVLFGKLLLQGWAVSVLVLALLDTENPGFELAFITNWSLVITFIYMSLSFLASLIASCSDISSISTNVRNFFVESLTLLFPWATVCELVCLLFWLNPNMAVGVLIVPHGPLALLLLLDGLLLNSIPVQAQQIVTVWAFHFGYMACLGVYALLDLANPNRDPNDPDKGIYKNSLNWRLYPTRTLVFTFAVLFVITPLCFALVWALSYYSRRLKDSRESSRMDGSMIRVRLLMEEDERTDSEMMVMDLARL